MAQKNPKKRPYLPKDGSETPHNILIPLLNFDFFHHTHNKEADSPHLFIGRDNLVNQLKQLLISTKETRGSYLIAGYRGSGKTSLINRVIDQYKKKMGEENNRVILNIEINLGHDAVLDTRHVLFNITSVIKSKLDSLVAQKKKWYWDILLFFLASPVILWTLISGFKLLDSDIKLKYLEDMFGSLIYSPTPIFISILLVILAKFFNGLWDSLFGILAFDFKKPIKARKIFNLIRITNSLYNRIAYSSEKNWGLNSGLKNPFMYTNKTVISPMMEPQIELELLGILEEFREAGIDIIFVFDELDKISLTVTEPYKHANSNDTDKFENETVDEYIVRRKKRIDSLLGSLKTLITVGKARFFFIAGRDMLDSFQAEKGSTSSLYESLFNQVFEVPSFLTDKSDNDKMRLHSMIEVYVCNRLIEENEAKKQWLANLLCCQLIEECQIKFDKKLSIEEQVVLFNKLIEKLNFKTEKSEKIRLEIASDSFLNIEDNLEKNNFEQKQSSLFAKLAKKIIKTYCDEDEIKNLLDKDKGGLFYKKAEEEKNLPWFSLNSYFLYLRDELDSEKDAELVTLTLRQFIYYLTIHSWGNCKRLASLFESFIKPTDEHENIENKKERSKLNNDMDWLPRGKAKYMLSFGFTERQRIAMGSNLYIMFGHHLSHQFAGADKLVVSTMAALHYCLKFHRHAFSRHHLSRMTEMMSIYSAPELNGILDTTITQVLWPYIRIVQGGFYRYRFFTWIEQEIRYIARTNDLESASYTFSLDSINEIKAHYRKSLEGVTSTYSDTKEFSNERGPSLLAEINIVLGDIHYLERSYDESVVYYQTAVNAHYDFDKANVKYHPECLLRYIEALLKLGNVQEHRQRYDRAAMNYLTAHELVNNYLAMPCGNKSLAGFIAQGDPKYGLFKQPYWAMQFLVLKRGIEHINDIERPVRLYSDKNDPQFQYRKGQLYFYLNNYDWASAAFLKVLQHPDVQDKKEFQSYLLPTACINLAENFLVKEMWAIKKRMVEAVAKKKEEVAAKKKNEGSEWVCLKQNLAKGCNNFLSSMKGIKAFEDFTNDFDPAIEIKNKDIDMKYVLQLIFYAANKYEEHKRYDHAAMAYLKAISLWILMFDMLPLYHFSNDKEQLENLRKTVNSMDKWFPKACKNAQNIIMTSNGFAQQQAREKWHFRDVSQKGVEPDLDLMGFRKMDWLDNAEGRKKLNDDIIFWQGSYLGQQLIFIRNWAFIAKRVLNYEEEKNKDKDFASLLKPYRIPVHATRSLIFASWANGRELLRLGRLIRRKLEYLCPLKQRINSNLVINRTQELSPLLKQIGKRHKERKIVESYKRYIKHELNEQKDPTAEQCYYIIVAKGIHNFYTALHYIRVLTENNQAIIFPAPAFVMANLWRLLYRLVEYEISKGSKTYEQARIKVRAELLEKYVSQDIPSSHLDLDYVASEAKKQLHALSTMGNVRSLSRTNILQNNYFLNDDYEDPGFHLDWTLIQMLIPSALMYIKWIEEDMKEIKLN